MVECIWEGCVVFTGLWRGLVVSDGLNALPQAPCISAANDIATTNANTNYIVLHC